MSSPESQTSRSEGDQQSTYTPEAATTTATNTAYAIPTTTTPTYPTNIFTKPTNNMEAAITKYGMKTDRESIWKVLAMQKNTPNDKKEMIAAVWGSFTPYLFCFMKPNNPFVQFMHSPARYTGEYGEPNEYDGNDIIFIGDRRLGQEPTPCTITDTAFNKWHKVNLPDDDSIEQFYDNDGNSKKMYTPPLLAPATTEHQVPTFQILPGCLISIIAEGTCRPYALATAIKALVENCADDDVEKVENKKKSEKIIQWCNAASIHKGGTADANTCAITWNPTPLIPSNDHFIMWLKKRLECTIGVIPKSPPSFLPPFNGLPFAPTGPATTTNANGGHTTPIVTTTGKTSVYSDSQAIFLAGFCGVKNTNDVPAVWDEIANTTSLDEVRVIIMDRMNNAKDELGVEISRIYLSSETLKDIKKLQFAPGDTAVWETLEKGISMLSFLPSTPESITELQREEQCAAETKGTRTLLESRKLSKKDPRAPAGDYYTLMANLTTYAMFLRGMFGKDCNHYAAVWSLRRTIKGRENKQTRFTGQYVRNITWAVLDDARQFFATHLTKEKFLKGLDKPLSGLPAIIGNVYLLMNIEGGDFPEKWKALTPSSNLDINGHGGGGGGGSSGDRYSRRERDRENLATKFDQEIDWVPVHLMHPKIADMMGSYKHKFGQLHMNDICKANNTRMDKLPKLDKYTSKDGKNTLCMHHILGRCTNRLCQYTHLDSIKLSDAFAGKLVSCLDTGIKSLTIKEEKHPHKKVRWGNNK